MKTKIIITICIVAARALAASVWGVIAGGWQARLATGQLSDDITVNNGARWLTSNDPVMLIMNVLVGLVLLALWARPLAQWLMRRKTMPLLPMIVAVVGLFTLTGCNVRIDPIEEIQPNETAFLVPLEGETLAGQAQFGSVQYFEQSKVAAKRVTIPQRWRSTGLLPTSGQWIPTVRVIKVDRRPATREWTKPSGTGTSSQNQAISVESKESIGFDLGVVSSASIREEDAAKFLYYYSGSALTEVMDRNVRGFIVKQMSEEFGAVDLDTVRVKKNEIFAKVQNQAKEYFKTQGITIDYIGLSEGLTYQNKAIQDAIDVNFSNQQKVQGAKLEADRQAIDNQKAIDKAKADAEVKRITADGQAKEIESIQKALNNAPQYIQYLQVQKFSNNLQLPQTLVMGNGQTSALLAPLQIGPAASTK